MKSSVEADLKKLPVDRQRERLTGKVGDVEAALTHLATSEPRCGQLGESEVRSFATAVSPEFSISFILVAAAVMTAGKLFAVTIDRAALSVRPPEVGVPVQEDGMHGNDHSAAAQLSPVLLVLLFAGNLRRIAMPYQNDNFWPVSDHLLPLINRRELRQCPVVSAAHEVSWRSNRCENWWLASCMVST